MNPWIVAACLALVIFAGLCAAMVMALLRDPHATPLPADEGFELCPSRAAIHAARALALAGLVFAVDAIRRNRAGTLGTGDVILILTALLLLTLALLAWRYHAVMRIRYHADGLKIRRLLSPERALSWSDLKSATVAVRTRAGKGGIAAGGRDLTLVTVAGESITVSSNLRGFDHFAQFAIERVGTVDA